MTRRSASMGQVLAVLATLTLTTISPQPASARPAAIALGAYVSGAPWEPSRLDDFAALIGRMPAIVMWYQDWGTPGTREFDAAKMNAVLARGATPMVTWDPWTSTAGATQPEYSPARIAAGAFDAYIREWAASARRWGNRFYLRFAHEMNASYYPWGVGNNGTTAADFKSAWRRVVDIFREERVTEVRWVWAPNVVFPGTAPFRDVYPGRSYVDVIGMDGYNWGTSDAWHRWTSLGDVFGESYSALAALDPKKPMVIAETASTEDGGDKAAWIKSAFMDEIPARFPRVIGVVWFHEQKETSWNLDSSSRALQAYRSVVGDARYQGVLP